MQDPRSGTLRLWVSLPPPQGGIQLHGPSFPHRSLPGAAVWPVAILLLLFYWVVWRSFLELWLYRRCLVSFQLVFCEKCSMCWCISDVFVGENELHILLCHLDPPPLQLMFFTQLFFQIYTYWYTSKNAFELLYTILFEEIKHNFISIFIVFNFVSIFNIIKIVSVNIFVKSHCKHGQSCL